MKMSVRTSVFERVFGLGIRFFDRFNVTLCTVRDLIDLLSLLKDKKELKAAPDPQATEQRIREAAYRFMGLQPGCGQGCVKKQFKEIVKEIRPDINIDELTKQKYIALGVARKILLEQETKA